MNKIIEAQDILTDARNYVECIFLAASGLGGGLKHEGTDPIQIVADTANKKIEEAIAILEEYRGGPNASQLPGAAAAKPVSPAARGAGRLGGRYPAKAVLMDVNAAEGSLPT